MDAAGRTRRRGLWALEVAAATTSVAVIVAAALTASEPPDAVALVLFAGLLIWAENVAVRLPTSTRVSPSFMVAMASITAYRGGGALLGVAITGGCGGLVIEHLRRKRFRIVAFNCSQYLLAAASAEGVYAAVRSTGDRRLEAVALLGAAAAFWAVNTGLIIPAIALDTGTPASDVWRDLAPTIPNYLAFGLLGTLLGYLYRRLGAIAVLLLASPIVVARSVFLSFLRLRQAYARLELLYGFTGAVGPTTDYDEVVGTLLPELNRLFHTSVAQLHLVAGDAPGAFHAATTDGSGAPHLRSGSYLTGLITERVTTEGKAFRISHSPNDPFAATLGAEGMNDALIAPVRIDHQVVGALVVANRLANEPAFSSDDVQLFETVANHASVSLERGRLIDRLRHDSTHDSLTGLGNRALFYERLEAVLSGLPSCRPAGAEQGDASGAVLLMDLDRFKEVNDTLGHDIGDALLQEIGGRLRDLATDDRLVARLGGDEFGVLLPTLDDPAAPARAADELLGSLRHALPVGDINLELGASIGIARFPADGRDAATLLRRADMAMYVAKADHLGWSRYDASADLSSPRRLAIASDLRRAIETGEMAIHFQPKADLRTGRCLGMEALVRWTHPRLGPLTPDEFIPLAEQTGLIRPLTVHVLARSLAALRSWRDLGHEIGLAVNLSVRALLDTCFPDQVAAELERHATPAQWLTMEITESSVMSNTCGADVLRRLAALGVSLSVDDFGTGYSSLTYLRGLPVQEVKIDRTFVSNMIDDGGDAVIVRSIVDLARHLGLRVVAEGVEDRAIWEQLRLERCDEAQGFYVAKPLPEEAVAAWLERWAEHARV